MSEWYKSAFSKDYIRIYQHRDPKEAQETIQSLLELIHLPQNAHCLDLCCGFGRHLQFLNELGIDTVGVDLSQDLIDHSDPSIRDRIKQGDMRQVPYPDQSFDFIFSFFTSFGYFSEDQENLKVFKEIHRCLKPGAGFLMDFLNPLHVKKNLVKEDSKDFGNFQLIQRRHINSDNNSVDKELIVTDENGSRTYNESVKLYQKEDFILFCKQSDLSLDKVLATADGEPWNENAKRMIFIGHKDEG